MPAADLVIQGTVLTVDDLQPTAEAVAEGRPHRRGRGPCRRRELDRPRNADDRHRRRRVMPGFVEAHGHPLMEAIALSDRMGDIRPVTLPKAADVVAAVKAEVAAGGSDGAYLNG